MAEEQQLHPDDEQVERYALGVLAAQEIPMVEQHLLICGACQDRVEEMDAYVQGMQAAARQLRVEEMAKRVQRRPKSAGGTRIA